MKILEKNELWFFFRVSIGVYQSIALRNIYLELAIGVGNWIALKVYMWKKMEYEYFKLSLSNL
jgi:hypothetical protein